MYLNLAMIESTNPSIKKFLCNELMPRDSCNLNRTTCINKKLEWMMEIRKFISNAFNLQLKFTCSIQMEWWVPFVLIEYVLFYQETMVAVE